jgi:hypothetical protein
MDKMMKNRHLPHKCLFGVFLIGCCTTSALAQQQVSEEETSLQIEEIIVLQKLLY